MNLLTQSLAADSFNGLQACGQLVLRAGVGGLIFYIHGWHKLRGGIAHLRRGVPWKLAEEVAEMKFPAPVFAAFVATLVQFVCSLFLIAGLATRLNAALLIATLGVAIFQNILTRRDPQLPGLYILILVAILGLGGGSFSCDAIVWPKTGL